MDKLKAIDPLEAQRQRKKKIGRNIKIHLTILPESSIVTPCHKRNPVQQHRKAARSSQ
jgi:hypothetical protein